MITMPMTAAARSPASPVPRTRGQALAEFLVGAMFFLVPLLLAVIALGKLADVRHTTAMAARYAAWERTIWYDDAGGTFGAINGANRKSAAQIGSEIAVRLLNDRASGTVIRSADRDATRFANGIDPMWHDLSHRPFLDRFEQHGGSSALQTPRSDFTGAVLAGIEALPLPPGVTVAPVPPVPSATMAVADVTLRRVAYGSAGFQRLWPKDVWGQDWNGLDFGAAGAIVSNTWAANGSGATRAMVARSVPTAQGLGSAVGSVVDAARAAWDPLAPAPEFGKVAPDVVPADRLKD